MKKEFYAAVLGLGAAIIPGAQAIAQEKPQQVITGEGLLVCPDPEGKIELDLTLSGGRKPQIGKEPNALTLSAQPDGVVVAERIIMGKPVEVFRFGGGKKSDKAPLPAGTSFIENPIHSDGTFKYNLNKSTGLGSKKDPSTTLSVTVTCNK